MSKMMDEDLDDMIMVARNGHMGRFNASELRTAFRDLEDKGYVIAKAPPPAPVATNPDDVIASKPGGVVNVKVPEPVKPVTPPATTFTPASPPTPFVPLANAGPIVEPTKPLDPHPDKT
jgi:hypothetical protein